MHVASYNGRAAWRVVVHLARCALCGVRCVLSPHGWSRPATASHSNRARGGAQSRRRCGVCTHSALVHCARAVASWALHLAGVFVRFAKPPPYNRRRMTCAVPHSRDNRKRRAAHTVCRCAGDVADATGCSPFPGSINGLVVALAPYEQSARARNGLRRCGCNRAHWIKPAHPPRAGTRPRSRRRRAACPSSSIPSNRTRRVPYSTVE